MHFWHWLTKEIVMKASMVYNDDDFRQTVEAFISGQQHRDIAHNDRGLTFQLGNFGYLGSTVTSRINISDVKEKRFKELLKNKDKYIQIKLTPSTLNF